MSRRTIPLVCSCLALLGACAGSAVAPRLPAVSPAYPGHCALLGVDQRTRESDMASDSIELVARYRPDGDEGTLGVAFEVRRERAGDLRAHLEQHPDVICNPEFTGIGGDDVASPPYQIEVPPFEGQEGRFVPESPVEAPPPEPASVAPAAP